MSLFMLRIFCTSASSDEALPWAFQYDEHFVTVAPSFLSVSVIAVWPGSALLSPSLTTIQSGVPSMGAVFDASHWHATSSDAAKKCGYLMSSAIEVMPPIDCPVSYMRSASMLYLVIRNLIRSIVMSACTAV